MIRINPGFLAFLNGCLLLLISIQTHAIELSDPETALKTYVNIDDGAFNIQHIVSVPGSGYTAHLYTMTSQKWLSTAEVDSPMWTHNLVMIEPNIVNSQTGLLFVGSGDNSDNLPDGTNQTVQIITQLALGSQSIVSAVFQTPNQPLLFNGEVNPIDEDKLVSYTWNKAMETGNYAWSAYLPMTKTVVKAMDGIQSVVIDHGHQINDFVLTGFSKRGAAVWLAAAVDPRVKAIAPGVIDFLNMSPSLEHHFKSYGLFSDAVSDYQALGIFDKLRSPEFRDLTKVNDPYSYRDQLDMPKFILNSSGDQFFLPDSSRFYLDDLKGETHIRFAPNTDHSLVNSQTGVADSLFSLLGWYQSILYGLPRPDINWEVENGALTATTSLSPLAVRLWTATNVNARDFRKEIIGETWSSTLLQPDATGEYVASLQNTSNSFTATYIEFVYQGLGGIPVTYSTQVYVTPDIYPFELTNPVNDPKRSSYWKRQVKAALKGKVRDIDSDTLTGYLPTTLFDTIKSDLRGVYEALKIRRGEHLEGLSERECMATRLNIKHGELGWYSSVDLGWLMGEKAVWEHYKEADRAAELGLPWLSTAICKMINNK